MTDPRIQHEEAERAALRARPVSIASKLAYSGGAWLDASVNTSLNIFLLFYVTTACGLGAGMAGAAIAMGLVVESVLDPLIGLYSDNWRSRWGRRLPFMAVGLPILLVTYVLLFSLPDTDNQWLLFGLVALLSLTVRLSLSLFNLPWLAAGAEITDDQHEREVLVAMRWGLAIVAAFVSVIVGFGLFFGGENGLAQRANYPGYAATVAALMLIAALLSMLAVRKTLGRQHAVEARPITASSIAGEFAELLRSHSFRVLFGTALLFSAAQGVTQSLNLHAYTFFWHLDPQQVQLITLAPTGGLLIGTFLAGPILARVEYRTAAVLGLAGLIVMQAVPAALRLLGVFPFEGALLANVMVGFCIFGGASTTVVAIAVITMITNAADEHELLFGVRREGSYFAGWTLAIKMAGGLGTLLSGLALQAIHFPSQQVKEQGMNIALPGSMTDMLGFYYGPGAAVLTVMSLLLLSRFRLTRQGHADVMKTLAARRAA